MSQSFPKLPEPVRANEDSMLTRKFGREVANYFSGSPLNRVSFLRPDHTFLTTCIHHPSTRFLLFNSLKPCVNSPSSLAFLKFQDLQPLVGKDPYSKTEAQMIEEYNSAITTPQMVFLGLDERKPKSSASSNEPSRPGDEEPLLWKDTYKGAPVFAVDVTPKGTTEPQASNILAEMEERGLKFHEGRMILSLPADEAAVYAQARALLDWNARNPFCAACGQPTLSVNAGGKRVCPPKDAALLKGSIGSTSEAQPVNAAERPPCATRTGVSNLSFPRTDPTVIMAVVSHDGKKVMLGRQKSWPPYWYSTLAGFCEPAESVEEAVRREVWEEAGVKIGRVVIHSTQPWAFPSNLMIGAIGEAIPGLDNIDLGNDPELDDAKWYTLEELREALANGTSGLGERAGPNYTEGNLRLPPPTAIANRLISSIAEGDFLTQAPKM